MPARVLVTGAGGPAGVAVIRSLLRREAQEGDIEVFAADMDGWASGLYLVAADRRLLVPPGASPAFVPTVRQRVADLGIAVVISTVDVELLPLARERDSLGAELAAPSLAALETCLDKWRLVQACRTAGAAVPRTMVLEPAAISADWDYPVIVKPRSGAGSRGVRLVANPADLAAIGSDSTLIVQENLPGEEYSVDTVIGPTGVIAAVPRLRARVDSGVAIAGRTVADPELVEVAAACARAAGLLGVVNVQLRRRASGRPALLEINPRFSGAMPLTIASGVDMPSLAVDIALGLPLPERVPFAEVAAVRFLEDVVVPVEEIEALT